MPLSNRKDIARQQSIATKGMTDVKKMIDAAGKTTRALRNETEKANDVTEKWTSSLSDLSQGLLKLSQLQTGTDKILEENSNRERAAAESLGTEFDATADAYKNFSKVIQNKEASESLKSLGDSLGLSDMFSKIGDDSGIGGLMSQLNGLDKQYKHLVRGLVKDDISDEMREKMGAAAHSIQGQMKSLLGGTKLAPFAKILGDEKITAISGKLMGMKSSFGSLGTAAQLSLKFIAEGLKQNIQLIDQLQTQLKFANIGFDTSAKYVGRLTNAIASTHGLASMEDSMEAFVEMHKMFRSFNEEGSKVAETAVKLKVGIGMSTQSVARLAFNIKTLGIKDVNGSLIRSGNAMAFFAKNTNLNTQEIEELIEAATPLFESFPDKLEKDMIPQLLGLAAAFKEVGIDSKAALANLEDMTDLSSGTGVFKAAMASSYGGGNFNDIMGGENVDQSSIALLDAMGDLMKQTTNGNPAMVGAMSKMWSKQFGTSPAEVKRAMNMSEEQRKAMREELRLKTMLAKQNAAMNDAMKQQLEGPMKSMSSAWTNIKTFVTSFGVLTTRVLSPVISVVSTLAEGVGVVFGFIGKLVVKASEGISAIYDGIASLVEMIPLVSESISAMKDVWTSFTGVIENFEYTWQTLQAWMLKSIGWLLDIIGVDAAADFSDAGKDIQDAADKQLAASETFAEAQKKPVEFSQLNMKDLYASPLLMQSAQTDFEMHRIGDSHATQDVPTMTRIIESRDTPVIPQMVERSVRSEEADREYDERKSEERTEVEKKDQVSASDRAAQRRLTDSTIEETRERRRVLRNIEESQRSILMGPPTDDVLGAYA